MSSVLPYVHRKLWPALRPLRLLEPILNAPSKRRLRKALNCADLRDAARARAHHMVFEYIDGGSDDQITRKRSTEAYADLELTQRVLCGNEHADLDLSCNVLGHSVDLPFFPAPTAGQRMFHCDGETAVAGAAAAHGSAFALSSFSTSTFDEVNARYPGPKIFQLYVWRDKEFLKKLLGQAKEAGFTSLALTADMAWFGNREREVRSGFSIPPTYNAQQVFDAACAPAWTMDFLTNKPYTYALMDSSVPADSLAAFMNSQINPAFDWEDARWLCNEWDGPVALKGVMSPEDAKKAVEVGFSSVWISTHGGRQLETAPATIDVLPTIRDAVGPDVEIVFDGGIMRGSHIAKALALGADNVAVGKACLFGLAAGGEVGVSRTIAIMKRELEITMGLMGCKSVDELKARGHKLVNPRRGVNWDHVQQ